MHYGHELRAIPTLRTLSLAGGSESLVEMSPMKGPGVSSWRKRAVIEYMVVKMRSSNSNPDSSKLSVKFQMQSKRKQRIDRRFLSI